VTLSEPSRPGPALRISTPQLTPSVRAFLAEETGSAVALLVATVLALVWANSPWWPSYLEFWSTPLAVEVGGRSVEMSLHRLVNDGAMALFFLVLGLEINRELTSGALRDRRTVMVPALGAIGGVVLPIAIYLFVNHGTAAVHGWGIVMSTDTAFVLGVLALFGPRCPDQLRLFLLTLAVVDDIAAITLMALFYTDEPRFLPMVAAVLLVAVLLVMRWLGVWRLVPYVLVGIALWVAVYLSGVHPTLAGVLVGLLIPASPAPPEEVERLPIYGRALIEVQNAERARLATLAVAASVSASERLQRAVHPWSAYVIVPVFGLANAGVHLTGDVLRNALTSPVSIGIVIALVVGNMVGITAAATFALRTGLGVLPGQVRYSHLVGGAILAGIGFTISLFITELAFDDPMLQEEAKIGILCGSLIAAALGAWVVRVMGRRSPLCSPEGTGLPPELPPQPWTSPAPGS